jgi:hypothetical protein
MIRCAQCGDSFAEGEGSGQYCKWCASEKQVRTQQASPAAYSPPSTPARSGGGMSGFTILRICLVVGVLLLKLMAGGHC